jgi:hypothetical protein
MFCGFTTEVRMSVGLSRFAVLLCSLASAMALTGCAALSPPASDTEVAGFTVRLVDEITAPSPEPIVGQLTIDDAVARAVRFNYTIRAKELEAALADAKFYAQSGAMLPSVVAESDYYSRDRPALSRSSQSPSYSTSVGIFSILVCHTSAPSRESIRHIKRTRMHVALRRGSLKKRDRCSGAPLP